MDKRFILALVPVFTFGIYPFLGRFFTVTPLRKIGIGLFVTAASFVIVAMIEKRIQNGHTISAWWQILAYVVMTMGEVLVSITALEFSYKQAPLRMKSFVMGLFLLSTSLGNLGIAAVNHAMVKPLVATAIETGPETWIKLSTVDKLVTGQKIDVANDGDSLKSIDAAGKSSKLEGTFLIAAIDSAGSRVRLRDAIERGPVMSTGSFSSAVKVSTYWLVGPMYFYFFVGIMCVMGVIYIFFAMAYKEQTHVRV